MQISATIKNRTGHHEATVQTNDLAKEVSIPARITGPGSSVNGGELLMLALATCFCNDLYREAAKRSIVVSAVDVTVTGEFGAEGEPGSAFTYSANVIADASPADIDSLIAHTDRVAEVHNTLRRGVPVTLVQE